MAAPLIFYLTGTTVEAGFLIPLFFFLFLLHNYKKLQKQKHRNHIGRIFFF
jgi:hypothetical protein